jgi:hypothetical protein
MSIMAELRPEGAVLSRIAGAGPFAQDGGFPYWDHAGEAFARAAIFTICSTGVSAGEARRLFSRCMVALEGGGTARMGFRNPVKADAIDTIWRDRERFYRRYREAGDKMAALAALPGIGPVTKHRLAWALDLFEADERDGAACGASATRQGQTGVTHAP